MSIYCCGRYHLAQEKRLLPDNETYENRFLEIIICPFCNKKKALLSQRRIKDGKLIEKTPKRGQVEKFIKKWSSEEWEDELKKVKAGTFNNMNWLYSIGMINKKPSNKIFDFNGEEKGEIDSPCEVLINTNAYGKLNPVIVDWREGMTLPSCYFFWHKKYRREKPRFKSNGNYP